MGVEVNSDREPMQFHARQWEVKFTTSHYQPTCHARRQR